MDASYLEKNVPLHKIDLEAQTYNMCSQVALQKNEKQTKNWKSRMRRAMGAQVLSEPGNTVLAAN